MSEETNKEEFSRRFFGSKHNIATIAVITVDTDKGKSFETTFAIHRIPFCKLSDSMLYSTYLLANVHPSLCEYWFGPENLNLENYVFGAVDTAGSPDVVFRDMRREGDQDSFRISSVSKDIGKYLLRNDPDTLDRVIDHISLELESRYGWNPEYRDIIEKITLRENVTLGYLYRHAAANLLTREQEERRKESLERLAVECEIQTSGCMKS